jgi:hypothetical protein
MAKLRTEYTITVRVWPKVPRHNAYQPFDERKYTATRESVAAAMYAATLFADIPDGYERAEYMLTSQQFFDRNAVEQPEQLEFHTRFPD